MAQYRPDLPYRDVVNLSDLHCGNVFGLWPPDFKLSDGGSHGLNKGQAWLWKCWLDAAARIKQWCNIWAYVTIGDLIDGVQYRQGAHEAITVNRPDQAEAAELSLRIFMGSAGSAPIFFVQGCLAEGHKVLTADLRWRPVEDLRVGDAVLTIERDGRGRQGRRWQVGMVTTHAPVTKETCEVTLTDGTRFVCTTDHPFLAYPYNAPNVAWVKAGQLKSGQRLVRLLPVWKQRRSYDAGYLAGILDGEASMQAQGAVEIGQRPGLVQERIEATLERMGHEFRTYAIRRGDMRNIHILGGSRGAARLLGVVRPTRLIGRVVHRMGRARGLEAIAVQSVKMLGLRQVVGMSTTSGTYLSDGFGSRQTEYHDARSGAEIERIAKSMGGVQYEGIGMGYYSKEVLDETVSGVTINYSHGIGVSGGLYRGTAPDREGIWSALAGRDGKLPPAPVVVRAHAHYFVHVEHESKDIIINPCWELQTRYMRKHSPYRMLPSIGLTFIRIWDEGMQVGDSRVEVKKVLYKLPDYYKPHVLTLEEVLATATMVEEGERGAASSL